MNLACSDCGKVIEAKVEDNGFTSLTWSCGCDNATPVPAGESDP